MTLSVSSRPAVLPSAGISSSLVFAMAMSCGLAVANIYYNQPMLEVMARDFPGQPAVAMITMLTQLGYAAGLLFLVPLGDVLERRWLIVAQFVLIAAACAMATLADSARRGAVVGSVMSGLLSGILLSRTLAGFITAYASWRVMFWLGVPLALLGAVLMARMIPLHLPRSTMSYVSLLRSLLVLWREEPALRRATLAQALLFASFSAFWTVLAFYLAHSEYHLGAAAAGLFGVIGIVGVLAAPLAGRMADTLGSRPVALAGALLALGYGLVTKGESHSVG